LNTQLKTKNLLVLGGGIDQVSGILTAKEIGFYTIVLDGNSSSEAKKYADEFYVVSIKHIEQIELFIRNDLKKKICGVIAFGVDIPYIIAKVSNLLNVNYTIPAKSALLSEDKYKSKCFMNKHNIAIPRYKLIQNIVEIDEFIEKNGFPIILKPLDNSAARGISFVNSRDKLKHYYDYALSFSKKNDILIEQYLSGRQISSESLIVDGDVYNIGFLDRNYDENDKFFPNIIENGGDMPSIYICDEHKDELKKYLVQISKYLNIKNGVIKCDLVIHDNKLYIIEFALRLSGGNFSTICIPSSTGINIIKNAIKLHTNIAIDKKNLKEKFNKFVSMRYKFSEDYNLKKNSNIISVNQKNKVKKDEIIFSSLHVKAGDELPSKTTDHSKRLGSTIATGNSREEAIKNTQDYLNNIEIIIE